MIIEEGTQFGPYRLLEKIGAGGMGEVYRVLDTRLEREVALKLVSDSYLIADLGSGSPSPLHDTPAHPTPASGSHASHERFLREARSAATLNHPNVCAIYDTGEQDGRPYLVMELLRGETLKRYLTKAGGHGLPAEEVVAFAQQAAAALAAAHAKGIIHRDIKPANLFVVDALRGKHQIKILDFGLAKKQTGVAFAGSYGPPGSGSSDETAVGPGSATMELTTPGSAVGTVAYMSPEQAKGAPLDSRTDLFSLGAVIYEMATGKTPFKGDSTAEVFAALLREDPPPVSTVNPAMPRQLDPIVAKLLAKDVARRYASAEELQEDLEGVGFQPAPPAASIAASKPKWPWLAAAAVLLLLAGGLAWWKYRPAAAPAPGAPENGSQASGARTTKDSLILADFVNHTGDPVFDTTLNQALQIDLEQSPVINIVSPQHLLQSVKYLGKPEGTPVTPAIAREIGEREGIKAIITGTIANLGKEYVITLTAQNTATGDEIVSEQAQAPDKEHVLDALGRAAAAMRGKLGEDLESIKKLDTPFGQATTSSLEAFRAYALGDKAHAKAHDIPEAEGHYLRATELDPNFAMAYARLGVVSINSGQVTKANNYFSKAYELSKNVSERERLYIAGHYYQNVAGNLPKVVETLQEAIQAYPGQIDNYININVAYQALGQYDQGLPYAQKAVEIDPQDSIAAENLLSDYVALGRMADVKSELERTEKMDLNSSTDDLVIQMVAHFLLGQPQEVQRVMAKIAGRPDEFIGTQILATIQQYSGQYRLAAATIQRAAEQAARAKAPDAQAGFLLEDVTARGLAGLCDSKDVVRQALSLDKSRQTQAYATLAAAICGDGKVAPPLAAELIKKYPQDSLIQDVFVPLSKAFIALAAGRAQEAIDAAEPAKPYNANYPASYLQGVAYLQLHDAGHALGAFQTATRANAGTLQTVSAPYVAQVQLGLARAYAMGGDKPAAKKAYEAFFATWKNADADLPMLLAAKKEYAAL
ncbi:MAG: serine/threonine-protein kinase [Acidobacteriaceae bacterium]|jgi:serine/threonine protein kinase/tetratricopeptide (TPR) repeat protein